MRTIIITALFLMILAQALISQVVVIVPAGSVYVPSSTTCINITTGTIIEFTRGNTCDAHILMSDETSASERDVFFAETSFSVAFQEEGIYTFFCGVPSTDLAGSLASVCYYVQSLPSIPSSGKKGITILALGILALGIFFLRRVFP